MPLALVAFLGGVGQMRCIVRQRISALHLLPAGAVVQELLTVGLLGRFGNATLRHVALEAAVAQRVPHRVVPQQVALGLPQCPVEGPCVKLIVLADVAEVGARQGPLGDQQVAQQVAHGFLFGRLEQLIPPLVQIVPQPTGLLAQVIQRCDRSAQDVLQQVVQVIRIATRHRMRGLCGLGLRGPVRPGIKR